MTPHLNSMSIFDAPRVVVVRSDDGCLSIHLGAVTISVYGLDPYKDTPELIEMTQEEWSKERTRQIIGHSLSQREVAVGFHEVAFDDAQVPTDVPPGDAPGSVGQAG